LNFRHVGLSLSKILTLMKRLNFTVHID
jgi:hypothetical protein